GALGDILRDQLAAGSYILVPITETSRDPAAAPPPGGTSASSRIGEPSLSGMMGERKRPTSSVAGGRTVDSGPMVQCRNCQSAGLSLLYNFGEQPLGGFLLPTAALARQAPRFVNALAICGACGLVQQAFDSAQEALADLVYSNYQPTYLMSAVVRAYHEWFLDAAVRLSGV